MTSSLDKLPVHIEREMGVIAPTFFSIAIISALIQTLTMLISGTPLYIGLFHNSAMWLPCAFAAIGVVGVLTPDRMTIDIDEQGIRIVSKRGRYFYAWADIACVLPLKYGVQLDVRGRTDKENQSNRIPIVSISRGIRLADLVNAGLERWGAQIPREPGVGSDRSAVPSDDVRAVRLQDLKRMFVLQTLVFVGAFIAVLGWQLQSYHTTVVLQKDGVKTNASVVRFYLSGCNRGGCSKNVEYVFHPVDGVAPPAGAYGFAMIAGGRHPDNPDYQYAKQQRLVPIIYDPSNPSRSALNFNNRLLLRRPLEELQLWIGLFGAILVVGLTIWAIVLLRSVPPNRTSVQSQLIS